MSGQAPEVVCLTNGQFAENCYLVADDSRGVAAIVDPGEESGLFLAEAARRRWTIDAIWLTHAHVDHILGVAAVKQATGAPIFLHPGDLPLYRQLPGQGGWMGIAVEPPPPPDHEWADGDEAVIGDYSFAVRHSPGHSPGSVSFLGYGMVFGGDVLFRQSIGRSDLPGGDPQVLMATIRDKFLTLPDDTVVHSGHGPATTIGYEKTFNPFLTGEYPLA